MIERRIRLFNLWLAGFIFVGTPVELWLTDHMGSFVQWIPFILSALGVLGVLAVLLKPQRRAIRGFQIVALLILLGSLFGVFEHVEHNIEFALEIRPTAVMRYVWTEGFTGANPLMAPGILALGALMGLVATYGHPALGGEE